ARWAHRGSPRSCRPGRSSGRSRASIAPSATKRSRRRPFQCRAWSPYTICFAMTFVSCTTQLSTRLLLLVGLAFDGGELLLRVAFDDGQHVILFHDEVLLAIQLDLLARILAKQDPVAHFDIDGDALAIVVHL